MKPVTQQRLGDSNGDCLAAAVASVLELELADIAKLSEDVGDAWWQTLECESAVRGFHPLGVRNAPAQLAPPGYAIAVGPSPRDEAEHHAVVTFEGDVVHDPHPEGSGITRVIYWILFLPLALRPLKRSPNEIDIEL